MARMKARYDCDCQKVLVKVAGVESGALHRYFIVVRSDTNHQDIRAVFK